MKEEPCGVAFENCRQGMDSGRTRARCFACGLPACLDCSVRMKYLRYGTQRIGFDCIEQGMPFLGPNDYAKGRAFVAQVLARREQARRPARRRPQR